MVTRLLLSDGGAVYPDFLSKEDRNSLRSRIEQESLTMRCSCCPEAELFYGISVDYRIIPLHKHYEHKTWCSRYQGDTRMVASTYDEDGNNTIYLKFNPNNFTIPKEKEEKKEEVAESPDNEKEDGTVDVPSEREGKKKEKLPVFSLRQMVRSINRDTYSERLILGKKALLSEEYFWNAVLGHLKKVYISGMERSLRDLSLEENQMCFFYGKLDRVEEKAIYMVGGNGVYRRFIFEKILVKAQDEFYKAYGKSVEECISEGQVYAAGFAYKRINSLGKAYICVGRVCFFIVSRNGLYVDSMFENDVLNSLLPFTLRCGGVFMFPDSDQAPYFGIFRIPAQGKEGYIYLNCNNGTDGAGINLCLTDVPEEEELREFVNSICFKQ